MYLPTLRRTVSDPRERYPVLASFLEAQSITAHHAREASDHADRGNDAQFRRYVAVLGLAELGEDTRFTSNQLRVRNRDTLVPLLQGAMLQRSKAEWLELLEAAQVPAGPINTVAEVFQEPQIQAREMQVNVPHPLNPDLQLVGNPIKLSRTPVEYASPPPMLGEHTASALAGLGWSKNQ